MGERLDRTQEVGGSNPPSSIRCDQHNVVAAQGGLLPSGRSGTKLTSFKPPVACSHLGRRVGKLSHEVHAVVGNTTMLLLKGTFRCPVA